MIVALPDDSGTPAYLFDYLWLKLDPEIDGPEDVFVQISRMPTPA